MALIPDDDDEETTRTLIEDEDEDEPEALPHTPRQRKRVSAATMQRIQEFANAPSRFQSTPKAVKAEKPLGVLGTIKEGAKSTARALGATIDTYQGDEAEVVEASKAQEAAKKDPRLASFLASIVDHKRRLGPDPSLWESIKAVGSAAIDNPAGAGLMVAEQIPNSIAALGAGGAGALAGSIAGPVGTVVGGLAGLAGANIGLETGHKALEAGATGSFSPEEQERVKGEGAIKGGVITGVDAVTLGATKFITGASRRAVESATKKTLADQGIDVSDSAAVKAAMADPAVLATVNEARKLAADASSKLGKRIAQTGGALALETIGEGVGEYVGEFAATGKADMVDAVLESISSLSQSMGEIAYTSALNKRAANRLFDTEQDAEKEAKKDTENTGIPHEVKPHPVEPEKFIAVPKSRTAQGIELDLDEGGNIIPKSPEPFEGLNEIRTQRAELKPGFQRTAEEKLLLDEKFRKNAEAYARNPIIIPGIDNPTPAPTPTETINTIIDGPAPKAKKPQKPAKAQDVPKPTPAPVKPATVAETTKAPKPEAVKAVKAKAPEPVKPVAPGKPAETPKAPEVKKPEEAKPEVAKTPPEPSQNTTKTPPEPTAVSPDSPGELTESPKSPQVLTETSPKLPDSKVPVKGVPGLDPLLKTVSFQKQQAGWADTDIDDHVTRARDIMRGNREPSTSDIEYFNRHAKRLEKKGETLRTDKYNVTAKFFRDIAEAIKSHNAPTKQETPNAKPEETQSTAQAAESVPVKKKPATKRNLHETLKHHFATGNIVLSSYTREHDRVLSFDWNNGVWSATVERVKKDKDGKWVATERPRTHSTEPDAKSTIISEGKTAFSRSSTEGAVANTQSIVNSVKSRWKNSPEVVVLNDMTEAPLSVRAENARQLSQGATGEPEGFISKGKVYLIASQLKTPEDVVRVLLHESLGHYGLRGTFNGSLETILKQVSALRRKDVEAKAKQYGLDISKESDRLIAAEEVLAEMAQANPQSGLVQRAIALIRTWLRQNIPGFENLKLSDEEIIETILIPAREFVQRGRGVPQGKNAFSRDSRNGTKRENQTDTPAFKTWFGDSKVVDGNGKPLVVYHGTNADIEFFDPAKLGSGTGAPSAKMGFFFAKDANVASSYADTFNGYRDTKIGRVLSKIFLGFYEQMNETMIRPFGKSMIVSGGNVMPLYLSIKNPLVVDFGGNRYREKSYSDILRQAKAEGRDGVILKNTFDQGYIEDHGDEMTDVYVAFNPEQIKSSIGNNGDFDPDHPGVHFSRAAATPAPTPFRERIAELTDTLIYNFQDRFKPLKDIQERAGTVPEEQDAALAEERYSGTVRARTDAFEEQLRDPLIKAIHDSGVAYEDVEDFLHALHAPSRNAAMKEINPTADELKARIDALTTERDTLAKDADVKEFLKLRKELRSAEADIEDGVADESLATMIRGEIARLRKIDAVKDYANALEKLKGLRVIKPFNGDNTALSGMSNAESKAILAKIDANGTRKALDKISSIVDTITSKTRQIYVDSGLEKADAIEAWDKKYEHYVPLHRDEVSGATMPKTGQGFNIRGRESKRATGSNKQVTNILAHVVAQHEAAIIRSEKARVDQTLFRFAQTHPDPSLWTLDDAPMIPAIDERTGLVVKRVDPTYKNKPEVLTLKIDGEEHTITFNEQNPEAMRLVSSMKNLSAGEMGEVTAMVGKFTRFLAQMNTTMNPVFTARNFLRDLQTAFVNLSDTGIAEKKKEVFSNVGSAIKGMWDLSKGKHGSKWAQDAEEFKNEGGQVGWMDHYRDIGARADTLKKELATMGPGRLNATRRTIKSLLEVIGDANNAVENGVRLSAYVSARNSGMSKAKAAQLAKNLTVNFNTHGARGVELNAWYMFMNASIQGTARLIKALSNRQVQKIVSGVVLSGFLLDILARSMAGDEDDDGENDYDQLPEHTKAMNFIFMVDGRPVTIPMPYGYNFFAATGRKVSEMMFRENYSAVKSAADLAGIFIDAFSPTGQAGSGLQYLSPTVTDPLVQWAENKNFAGNPLRRPQTPFGVPNPEYQMGFKSTSAPAKWLAEILNDGTGGNEVRPGFVDVNPAFFDFAVSSILGGAGRTALQTVSGPIKAVGDDEIQAREVPFLNIFVGAKPEHQTERKYFEAAKKVELAKKEIKTYREKGDHEMVRQIREEHAEELKLVEAAKNTKKVLERLRKRDLLLDKADPENKATLRKAIEEQKRIAMAKFNKQYQAATAEP